MERLLFRVEEAAEIVGLSRSKTYELVLCGEIPSIKVGRSRRISRVQLEQWIARKAEGAAAADAAS